MALPFVTNLSQNEEVQSASVVLMPQGTSDCRLLFHDTCDMSKGLMKWRGIFLFFFLLWRLLVAPGGSWLLVAPGSWWLLWLRGFLASWLLGFLVSWLRGFLASCLLASLVHGSYGSSGFFGSYGSWLLWQ